jgi:hypothetical protein
VALRSQLSRFVDRETFPSTSVRTEDEVLHWARQYGGTVWHLIGTCRMGPATDKSAEGVANLDQVPEAGALVIIGYPKFGGGLGGYARYIAVCPSDWPYGVTIGQQDAPLPKSDKPLHYDAAAGMRVR